MTASRKRKRKAPKASRKRASSSTSPATSEERSKLLTAPEVASEVRRDVRTVRRWIADGDLPVVTLGGRDYVRASVVDRLLAGDVDEASIARVPGLLTGL